MQYQPRPSCHPHVGLGLIAGYALGLLLTLLAMYLQRGRLCESQRRAATVEKLMENRMPLVEYPNPCSDAELAKRNNTRNVIFIGIMTANKYLDSRVPAALQSWVKSIPGVVAFFTAWNATDTQDYPVVALPDVDDTYPPQKKAFMTIKYMHDHCLEKFDWFIRADDDVFIRGDRLEKFLNSVNSSKPQYIGHPGFGNPEEMGKLSLVDDENYCMGGPGMIFSRKTLKEMAPHIQDCLHCNLFSDHEDVEIGRCVQTYVGIPCTWNYEMKDIFFHNGTSKDCFTGDLRIKEMPPAISLHPIKRPEYLHVVDNHYRGDEIRRLRRKIIDKRRTVSWMESLMLNGTASTLDQPRQSQQLQQPQQPQQPTNGVHPFATFNQWRPKDRRDYRVWDHIKKEIYSHKNLNPKMGANSAVKTAVDESVRAVIADLNARASFIGRTVDFQEVLHGYLRHNPLVGTDYMLNLRSIYRQVFPKKSTMHVRKMFHLHQPFSHLEMREMGNETMIGPPGLENRAYVSGPVSTDSPFTIPVHIIVPMSGRALTFRRFLRHLERACFQRRENVKLVVIVFRSKSEPSAHRYIESRVQKIAAKYPDYYMRVIHLPGAFSRGIGLDRGASLFPDDALLFFCDVDMVVTPGLLRRIRQQTILRRQIFYPIMFSEYHQQWTSNSSEEWNPLEDLEAAEIRAPHLADERYGETSGYWRRFSFGMVSCYKADFNASGGFDLSIVGWGKEDTDLYEKFVHSNLTIFRTSDPGLVHVFHDIHCDPKLAPAQLKDCYNTQASTFASALQMGQAVLKIPEFWRKEEEEEDEPPDDGLGRR